jgi:hypothetical protein
VWGIGSRSRRSGRQRGYDVANNKIEEAMKKMREKDKFKKKADRVQRIAQQVVELLAQETAKDPSIAVSALLMTLYSMFSIADAIRTSERFSKEATDNQMFNFEREISRAISAEVEQLVLMPEIADKKTTIH